jgi:hypothetical protein
MRRRNERIARAARAHRFGEAAPVPFLCECSDDHCVEILRMPLALYRDAREAADFLAAPGHEVDDAEIARVREHCWLFRVDAA